MRYPFLYSVIGQISIEKLSADISPSGTPLKLYEDWYLKPFSSTYLSQFVKENLNGMLVEDDVFFVSVARYSHFHIDKRNKNYVTHRVLIPLDTHFHYEWFVNDRLVRYKPQAGEVIVFNNLVPHRFILDEGRSDNRCVVYFNMIDPGLEPYFTHFQGSLDDSENIRLNEHIKKVLGLKD